MINQTQAANIFQTFDANCAKKCTRLLLNGSVTFRAPTQMNNSPYPIIIRSTKKLKPPSPHLVGVNWLMDASSAPYAVKRFPHTHP